MSDQTDSLLSELFAAKDASKEQKAALALSEHLRDRGIPFSLALRTINGDGRLTSQEFLKAKDAVAVLQIGSDAYTWRPVDPANTDMFFLE